jgi:hypothetical protein
VIASFERLDEYTIVEVLYHVKQCELSGFLTKVIWFMDGGCQINDLSPYGHEFLANIRSDNNWCKTKDIAKGIGSMSLGALTDIASNVVLALINKKFQI